MPLKLMYITNNPDVARIAEENGVDRIWVDLETLGKEARQPGMNTVKSNHTLSDVSVIRDSISTSDLLVRVNPLNENSKNEIDEAINRGADIVMLPMFRTADDAKRFVDFVNGRAKVLLLLETIDAEKNIESIVSLDGIDEIHIGLNDLHLEHKQKFMFELLANGNVEALAKTLKKNNIPFGFGGIARLDEGKLPAQHIIAEHYRLGSSMAILSRSFCDSINNSIGIVKEQFEQGMARLRHYEDFLIKQPAAFFIDNQKVLASEVENIVRDIR